MRRSLALLFLIPLLAGCTDAPAADTDSVDDGMPEEEPQYETRVVQTPVETPVDWSGHTKEGVFVCPDASGASGCAVGQQINPDGAYQTTIPFEGNLTSVSLTLEWAPADASQTGLVLAIYDDDGALGTWDGTSTFTVDEELASASGSLIFNVWPTTKGGVPGSYLFLDATQQEFTVTGTITGTVEETVQVPVE